jgi:hypothetical protein
MFSEHYFQNVPGPFRLDPAAPKRNACKEGDMMIDGPMVLVLAFAILGAIWAIVIYGSTYFGPKT